MTGPVLFWTGWFWFADFLSEGLDGDFDRSEADLSLLAFRRNQEGFRRFRRRPRFSENQKMTEKFAPKGMRTWMSA